MTDKQRAALVIEALEKKYPAGECGLAWTGDAFRLIIMAILSAQCTDARVNLVSPALFAAFPTPEAMAGADIKEIEELIRSVGLYHSKALALKECSARIAEVYGGEVPREMKDLLTLRGVGRKVANLVRGDVFGLGGIVADTHCIRINGRLGFSGGKDPLETEKSLDKLIPPEKQSAYCHRMVLYGREICTARSPKCGECVIKDLCRNGNVK
ncbi:MAG: endonuclease III [Clostridia bacterium]|nr:endonuclease III [Clostridia bacterium]